MKEPIEGPAPQPQPGDTEHVKNVVGVMLILFALLIVSLMWKP